MHRLKAGDIVECIDDTKYNDFTPELELYASYKIQGICNTHGFIQLELENYEGQLTKAYYNPNRFITYL